VIFNFALIAQIYDIYCSAIDDMRAQTAAAVAVFYAQPASPIILRGIKAGITEADICI